jgi:hypothetical protein
MRDEQPIHYSRVGVLLLLTAGMVLAACNLTTASQSTADVSGLYTAAAGTMVAQLNDQLTQTSAAKSPVSLASPSPLASFTPLPTFPLAAGLTPFGTFAVGTPGAALLLPTAASAGTMVNGFSVGCNNATFMAETIPDKTVMNPRHDFYKSWDLQNSGTCTWDEGYTFSFKSGEQLGGANIKITTNDVFTTPGHTQTFEVHLYAPKLPGEYVGYWQMKDDSGNWFGSLLTVDIIVQ